MATMHLTLREEDRKFLEKALKTGRYATEGEVVSDALAELRAREELREARLAEMRSEVFVGINQIDNGEGGLWDSEEVKAKGRALLASQKSQ